MTKKYKPKSHMDHNGSPLCDTEQKKHKLILVDHPKKVTCEKCLSMLTYKDLKKEYDPLEMFK